jgi:flagellar hook-associated protein 1 FlgK
MGISQAFGVGTSALLAHQLALRVAGQNIANANTPGYSRQRLNLIPLADFATTVGSVGRGVDAQTVARIRDGLADLSYRNTAQALGEFRARRDALRQTEAIFGEPAAGALSQQLAGFFDALQGLANAPTSVSARTALREQGHLLAATFNRLNSQLTTQKTDLQSRIADLVGQANTQIALIADLNRQIAGLEASGNTANDLRDRRDRAVDTLADLLGTSVSERADHTLQVALAGTGVLLVDGASGGALTSALNGGTDQVEVKLGGTLLPFAGGQLKGLLDVRNGPTYLPGRLSNLDALAKKLIEQVNRVHSQGAGQTNFTSLTSGNAVSSATSALNAAGLPFTPVNGSFRMIVYDSTGAVVDNETLTITAASTTLNGLRDAINANVANVTAAVSGGQLSLTAAAGFSFAFADDTSDTLLALGLNTFFSGAGAGSMAVNPVIQADPSKIVAASPAANGTVSPGDNTKALALAQLRASKVLSGGTATFESYLGAEAAVLGSQIAAAQAGAEAQELLLEQAVTRRSEASGVNLDEEMTALLQAQHAFEAASRYVRALDELLQDLLAQLGG